MIDQRLVTVALEKVDTDNFEKFAQTFYGAMQDREFVPLGGIHDGGAEGFDALVDPEVFQDETATRFIQVSKQKTVRAKIRNTVKRLRDYGRTPKVMTLITSEVVKDIDKMERELSKELGCRISVRDANFISNNINFSHIIEGAFKSYLEPCINYLYHPGTSNTGSRTSDYTDKTLAVFLRQEVDHRRGRSDLLETVADSLILWSLSETNPDLDILFNRSEILSRIESALPSARKYIRGVLDSRLEILSSKGSSGARQIRHYSKRAAYCLPYETRVEMAAENADDDLLKLQVSCVFEDRFSGMEEAGDFHLRTKVVSTCHDVLERSFERQGLQVAVFASDGEPDDELYTDVASILANTLDEYDIDVDAKARLRRYCTQILRGTFYLSTDVERLYLQKLSRTYVLLLLLKNEPKVVEYFKNIASSFKLYIGTDLIIRAMSETYLSEENQVTVNLFKVLKSAGADLILTEKCVEEVATHLRRQIFEYENHYEAVDEKMPLEWIEYIDRLLIRAYFHSRLSNAGHVQPPKSWRAYIEQFASYKDIRANQGDKELGGYLIRKFDMSYESVQEMLNGIDNDELEHLTKKIHEVKQRSKNRPEGDVLAYNDALHVLRVYKRRIVCGEESPGNPFGFQTWWLTQDGKVRKAVGLSDRHRRNRFMMRPEFLLNYISFSPDHAEVVKSYRNIFPTVLGVRLSSRLPSSTFQGVLAQAAEAISYDPARAGAVIAALTDKLKGDQMKIYENKWEESV